MSLMNALVAAATNHDAVVELLTGIVFAKPRAPVHFSRNEVVEGKWHSPLAARAGCHEAALTRPG